MIKKYKISFDPYGLLLFVLIMLPNLLWFAIPAPVDVLRNTSSTPIIDNVASVCQVVMIMMLCLLRNIDADKVKIKSKWIIATIIFGVLYFSAWILYYLGMVNDIIIIALIIFPCVAFLLYEVDRKNWLAFIPTIAFLILHAMYGVINFIL